MRYVRIDSPVEFKRANLESMKGIIHSLQRMERLERIRAQKQGKLEELKQLEKVISALNNKLKSMLPKVKGARKPTVPVSAPMKKTQRGKRGKSKSAAGSKKPAAPLDRLEKELQDIESKLGKLE